MAGSPNSMVIGGTGHRTQFFPDIDTWQRDVYESLVAALYEAQPNYVISGGCYGWDLMFAEAAMELEIPIHLYLPFPSFGERWYNAEDRRLLQKVKEYADIVYYSCSEYSRECYFIRDEAIANNSDIIYALLHPDARSGGTYYTTKYAYEKGKEVINFWQ